MSPGEAGALGLFQPFRSEADKIRSMGALCWVRLGIAAVVESLLLLGQRELPHGGFYLGAVAAYALAVTIYLLLRSRLGPALNHFVYLHLSDSLAFFVLVQATGTLHSIFLAGYLGSVYGWTVGEGRREGRWTVGIGLVLYALALLGDATGLLPYAAAVDGAGYLEVTYGAPIYRLFSLRSPPFVVAFVIFLVMVMGIYWVAAYYRSAFEAEHARALRAESLAALGQLVTGAAHELRTPLGSSTALLDTLREEISETREMPARLRADAIETLEMSLRAQGRARTIVDRLYRLSGVLTGQGAECPVDLLLKSLRQRYPNIEMTAAPEAASLHVEATAMTTILSNLADNALAASGKEPPTLAVGLSASSPALLEFVVQDFGRGIPASMQGKVFQPFFAIQSVGRSYGAGLGLYIVHELSRRLGGSVDLESEEGRGTTVRLRIPALGG